MLINFEELKYMTTGDFVRKQLKPPNAILVIGKRVALNEWFQFADDSPDRAGRMNFICNIGLKDFQQSGHCEVITSLLYAFGDGVDQHGELLISKLIYAFENSRHSFGNGYRCILECHPGLFAYLCLEWTDRKRCLLDEMLPWI